MLIEGLFITGEACHLVPLVGSASHSWIIWLSKCYSPFFCPSALCLKKKKKGEKQTVSLCKESIRRLQRIRAEAGRGKKALGRVWAGRRAGIQPWDHRLSLHGDKWSRGGTCTPAAPQHHCWVLGSCRAKRCLFSPKGLRVGPEIKAGTGALGSVCRGLCLNCGIAGNLGW